VERPRRVQEQSLVVKQKQQIIFLSLKKQILFHIFSQWSRAWFSRLNVRNIQTVICKKEKRNILKFWHIFFTGKLCWLFILAIAITTKQLFHLNSDIIEKLFICSLLWFGNCRNRNLSSHHLHTTNVISEEKIVEVEWNKISSFAVRIIWYCLVFWSETNFHKDCM
jgi:hypothetical protein